MKKVINKRFQFFSPEYSRTMLQSYEFAVPTISDCKKFTKIIHRNSGVKRNIDLDAEIHRVNNNNDETFIIQFIPMFQEIWSFDSNIIDITIVLTDETMIEILCKSKIRLNGSNTKYKEFSNELKLVDTVKIKNTEKYKNLFTLTTAHTLGQELIDKQNSIEELLSEHDVQIKKCFRKMINTIIASNDIVKTQYKITK